MSGDYPQGNPYGPYGGTGPYAAPPPMWGGGYYGGEAHQGPQTPALNIDQQLRDLRIIDYSNYAHATPASFLPSSTSATPPPPSSLTEIRVEPQIAPKIGHQDEEDLEEEPREGRNYKDHYGQDLSRVPRWRLVEMLRLSQQQCEQLEEEVQQLQARIDAQVEANRREQEEREEEGRLQTSQAPQQPESFVLTLLPSSGAAELASLDGVRALAAHLSDGNSLPCVHFIAYDDYRAVQFMAKRLGDLHDRLSLAAEVGYEEQSELRNLQVESIRVMVLIGEKDPSVYDVLAHSFGKWLTPDLGHRDDPERLFYDLTILAKIGAQTTNLPAYIKTQFDEKLIDQVINIISYEDDTMAPHALKAIHDAALLALVSINLQFDSADTARNPVVARLAAINGQDLGDLGQTFIIAFNREVREAIPPLVKLLRDLFSNPVTAKDFFFPNDLKVLVEIIMREVTDTEDEQLAGMYLEVLQYLLINSEYPKHIHRQKELSAFLLGLIRLEDDQTLGPLALRASAIFDQCPYLQQPQN